METIQQIIDKAGDRLGLDMYSQYDLVCEYLEHYGNKEHFEEYVNEIAANQKEMEW
jgi:hypothetical protein